MNIKLLASALLAFSFLAHADPTYRSTVYVERGGENFRDEYARQYPKCKPVESARKIYHVKSGELREVAYWDKQGKIHEAGKSNNPEVHKKVDEIFAEAQIESANPCLTPAQPSKSGNAVLQ